MNHKTIFSLLAVAYAVLCSSCASSDADNAASPAANYPIAKQMVDPESGEVMKDHYVSPFRPYNPIVAKGFVSGQLAGDPSTVKNNPETGKPDLSTIKVFKLP